MFRFRTTLSAVAIALTIALGPLAYAQDAASQEAAQPRPITVQELGPATVYTPVPSAQPIVVPIQNSDGSWDLTPLIDGFVKFAGGCLALAGTWLLAQASWPFKKWLGIDVDTKNIGKDLQMDKYALLVAAEAIRYVKQQTGLSDEDLKNVELRNPFLQIAARYIFDVDNDVWKWVSSKEQGVMKWLEANLDPSAALPKNIVDGVGPVPLSKAAPAAA